MRRTLTICNRQRAFRVDLRRLRRIIHTLLEELFEERRFDIGICLVDATEMLRLNETFLRHAGVTDVITFDYCDNAGAASRRPTDGGPSPRPALHGEVFICAEMAAAQARRFRTTWQSELARYITHGLLHLRGFDDLRPASRRRMKREEARLLNGLSRRFELEKLGAGPDCPPAQRGSRNKRSAAVRAAKPRPAHRRSSGRADHPRG